MITAPRIIVTVALLAAVYTLGQVAGCNASRPYGTPGVALHAYLTSPTQ